ncbi:MAG: hypothetical protein AABY00_02940 [Nanoarchaeota archaeon]
MEITAFTIHNPKYLQHHPIEEDYFLFNGERDRVILVVADGITRDPVKTSWLPAFDDKEAIKKAVKNYPHPSPARLAAEMFCKVFVKEAKNFNKLQSLSTLFEKANSEIAKLNKELRVDYLENDFGACVGAGAIIENNTLYWGFLTDCGIAIFDSEGNKKFQTLDEGPSKLIDREAEERKTSWRDPTWRAYARKQYRNNPLEKNAYGAFTGESNALHYLRTGTLKLEKGDFVVVYSDGMLPLLTGSTLIAHFSDLKETFKKNAEKIAGSEGTIVALQHS